jgi:hypothetical protein
MVKNTGSRARATVAAYRRSTGILLADGLPKRPNIKKIPSFEHLATIRREG